MKGRPQEKEIYCEGGCDHVVLWNFRLHFEPTGLPPVKKSLQGVGGKNGREGRCIQVSCSKEKPYLLC
jgi:hypothetical protein